MLRAKTRRQATSWTSAAAPEQARQQLGDIATWEQVRGDLLGRTLTALQAAGIAIPYRQIDINLRQPQEP
ncbi:hypothetical protein [Janthinobacterium aquaticum]|uniref:hypothetical protein n=1 Tax=Janthinobacterium sp. FT58W TaxID=2654254 RepID=UPI0012652DA6|nr:hypothetical protein [Janthinobacterium sp. FT58W]KAB8045133.1 hypothetical protein GCM43_01505 [Janthinobacterium sp. FT58W]